MMYIVHNLTNIVVEKYFDSKKSVNTRIELLVQSKIIKNENSFINSNYLNLNGRRLYEFYSKFKLTSS